TFGQGAGDKAEQLQKDLKSEDKEKRAAAQKEIDDLKNKADQMAKNNPPKKDDGPGKKVDPDKVEKALDDLNSDDPNKRKQAKQEFDKEIGEQARKELQEVLKDPRKAQDLKNKLEKINPKGGDPTAPLREAMKEDARNRAKSAELQLVEFEKNRFNKEV